MDWTPIPKFPFIMKSKFDEDGYILMVSDLKKIYVEKLDERAVKERFQILNPYAEMRSKIILKYVEQSLESILADNSDCEIDFAEDTISFHLRFSASETFFVFDLQLKSMTNDKFRVYVLAPTLFRALSLSEENQALKRKIELLEKKESTTLPILRSNDKQKVALLWARSTMKMKITEADTIEAFLYLQKNKITSVLESPKNTPSAFKCEIPSSDSQKSEKSIVPQKREVEYSDCTTNSNEILEETHSIKVETTLKVEHHQRKKKKLLNL
ncbi:uncharacterized protein NPIL_470912 [Nephila pilipes]|uniref:Non-homologous end-joining factor 1 n=1 Tax=Nephila pilipes TaxID=299642 RepID=A0A8X6QZ40_NEPPI|nr:uncharacterized protein NPIL_470912 [Nephila pilipes]